MNDDNYHDLILHEPWSQTPTHAENAFGDNKSGFNTLGQKFRVAASNASEASSWDNAIVACKQYSEAGVAVQGKWRLPTIRELNTIYDNRNKLTAVDGFGSAGCWAATEVTSNNGRAWNKWFASGNVYNKLKGDALVVRCVTDLTTP